MAARAAIDLNADKLIVMTTPDSQPMDLPLWLPLSDAEALLRRMAPDGEQAEALNGDLQRGVWARVCWVACVVCGSL